MSTPTEPPPSYDASTSNPRPNASQQQDPSHLEVPHKTRSGIPPLSRRSMEDESRPLPAGWVRQFDTKSQHQFYVDTTTDPPRSIWHHPYDDDAFMSSLKTAERERIEGLLAVPNHADIEAESSMDDDDHHTGGGGYPTQLPPRQGTGGDANVKGVSKFGRKMKDKITNSTHQEREQKRAIREAEEAETYRRHQHIRQQMAKAAETGQPQLLGKDKDGKDVYIEPPTQYGGGGYGGGGYGGLGGGYGGGFGGGYGGGYGYNPYSSGVYNTPNARYIRPQDPYSRPYGYGYGGGMGMPLLGGLGGGMLLGGLLF